MSLEFTPRSAGLYPFTSANVLCTLDPLKRLGRNVVLASFVASEACEWSSWRRARTFLTLRCIFPIIPDLLCLRTGLSWIWIPWLIRKRFIGPLVKSLSAEKLFGAPCRSSHLDFQTAASESADRWLTIVASEHVVPVSMKWSTQCFVSWILENLKPACTSWLNARERLVNDIFLDMAWARIGLIRSRS